MGRFGLEVQNLAGFVVGLADVYKVSRFYGVWMV